MKTNSEKTKSIFWAAFWSGIAAPAFIYSIEPIRFSRINLIASNQQDDMSAMRSDWIAVGNDFKNVISRQKK